MALMQCAIIEPQQLLPFCGSEAVISLNSVAASSGNVLSHIAAFLFVNPHVNPTFHNTPNSQLNKRLRIGTFRFVGYWTTF